MSAQDVQGELHCADGLATGWCWLPARPRDRLRVALLVDGRRRGATTAARLRLDLVRDGVRDGYHGFSLPLPDSLGPDTMLEAQELGTGRVFARLLGSEAPHARGSGARLDEVDAVLRSWQPGRSCDLLPRLAGLVGETLDGSRLRNGARQGIVAPLPGPTLHTVQRPAVSLLLDAVPDGAGALLAATRVLPLLRRFCMELLVADAGASSASAGLAAIPGIRLLHGSEAAAAGRINALLHVARGDRVCILSTTAVRVSSLARLLVQACGMPDAVLLGPAANGAAVAAGVDELLLPLFDAFPAAGLGMVAPRHAFTRVGEFDPMMDDGAGLMDLEFGVRARAAGLALHAWHDPALVPSMARPGSASARQRFALQHAAGWMRGPQPSAPLRATPIRT